MKVHECRSRLRRRVCWAVNCVGRPAVCKLLGFWDDVLVYNGLLSSTINFRYIYICPAKRYCCPGTTRLLHGSAPAHAHFTEGGEVIAAGADKEQGPRYHRAELAAAPRHSCFSFREQRDLFLQRECPVSLHT